MLKSLEAIGKQAYENTGAAGASVDPAADDKPESSAESKEEDIVEADFEVVDDAKEEDKS